MSDLKIKSYETIIKEANEGPDAKKEASLSKSKKLRASAELDGSINKCEIAVLDAESAFEAAVVAGTDIASKALALKAAQETHKFHVELKQGLFPNQ